MSPETPRAAAESFDDLYLATRRDLVLQTYALTGDLAAARTGVREAFVSARHHWNKVSKQGDPLGWIRPRAWVQAKQHHVSRLWHRDSGVGADQRATLDALHDLSDSQRETLILVEIAGLSPAAVGSELGERVDRVVQQLAQARTSFAAALGITEDAIPDRLAALRPITDEVALPRPDAVARIGVNRSRFRLIVNAALIIAAIAFAGFYVVANKTESTSAPPKQERPPKVSRAMLLPAPALTAYGTEQSWRHVGTSDNTEGTGINLPCQGARFADQYGVGTFVRKYATTSPNRAVVETLEVSATPTSATRAYQTTVDWYAGCSQAGVQLLNAYTVAGIGERAQLIRLRVAGPTPRTLVVGVARTGAITVSTAVDTTGGRPPRVPALVSVLDAAVDRVCGAEEAGSCPTAPPAAKPVLPPPSGETPGTLAVADLPPVGDVQAAWAGTNPAPGNPNLAATLCDRADFVKAGAATPLSRTFVIPQAKLPKRFGITETWGQFANKQAARAFVTAVTTSMQTCEDKRPGSSISGEIVDTAAYRGSQYALWRLDTEINESQETVSYWMGITRVGRWVAQVNFTPAGGRDLDEETFQALITRARDRLFEVNRPPVLTPTPSAPASPTPTTGPTP